MFESQQVYSFDESTGYWLRQVYLAISEALQIRLDPFDVTVAQWPVLSSLYSGHSQTPAELAEHIGVNRGAITRLLDRLEKKELVERESSAHDGRSFQVRLTERGRSIVPQLAALSREVNGQFLSGLSSSQVSQLEGTLRSMLDNSDQIA
jgi:DNA-binding MarR family transcriptional regulator